MSNDKRKSYQERHKRMKDSIEKNKDICESDFPDDVTLIGNPDLLDKSDDEIDEDSCEDTKNGN